MVSLGPKVPFTKEEDAILKRIVEQYQRPDGNWAKICDQFNLLPGTTKRNIRQVRERYKNYLDPNLTNLFNAEELDEIFKLHNQNLKPVEIARKLKKFPRNVRAITDFLQRGNNMENF